jgi:glycosyltransferase involved in cell wall biosynthesis
VSVVIPAYNRAGTILRAIRSVQEQTFPDWELLVVDDASTDNTCGVVETLKDPRIRILRQSANGGPGVARQRGLDAAAGEFVAFLDSDDEWLPEKIARQIESNAPVVSCGYLVRQGHEEWPFIHPPVDDWVEHLHFRCMLRAGSTLLTRRESALAIGGFDSALRYYEDWDLALRLAGRNPLTVIGEPLARIHVGASRSVIAAEPSIREFLRKHDPAFRRMGSRHRRRVRGQHLQNLAAGAFAGRHFWLGAKWLIESFAANPFQNPARLAALALAPIDAALGTSFLQTAAARVRRSTVAAASKPAP